MNKLAVQEINVSLVQGCNCRCAWCPRPDEFVFLSKENLIKIVDKINEEVGSAIRFFIIGGGETFLHPNVTELLPIFNQLKIRLRSRIELWTNGTLLTEQVTREMFKSGVPSILVISVAGYGTKESYEYAMPGARFDEIVPIVDRTCRIRNEMKSMTNVIISSIIPQLGSVPFEKPPQEEIVKRNAKLFPLIDGIRYRDIIRYNGTYSRPGLPSRQLGKIRLCRFLRKGGQIIVSARGTIHPCCRDLTQSIVIGNIFEDSLWSIYNGGGYTEIINGFNTGNLHPVCALCDGAHSNSR